MDRLVVEGQATESQKGGRGDLASLKDTGYDTKPIKYLEAMLLILKS
jgi:hypothetical protein